MGLKEDFLAGKMATTFIRKVDGYNYDALPVSREGRTRETSTIHAKDGETQKADHSEYDLDGRTPDSYSVEGLPKLDV